MSTLEQIAVDELLGRLTHDQAAQARAAHGCEVCGGPTDTPPECTACGIRDDAAAARRADR